MKFLKRIARSPYLRLTSGIVLIMAAIAEFVDAAEDPEFGLHHGVLVAGLMHVVQSLAHIFHGAHDLEEATEALKEAVAARRASDAADADEASSVRRD